MKRRHKKTLLRFLAGFLIMVTILTSVDITGVTSLIAQLGERIGLLSEADAGFLSDGTVHAAAGYGDYTAGTQNAITSFTVSSPVYGAAGHGAMYYIPFSDGTPAFCCSYGMSVDKATNAYQWVDEATAAQALGLDDSDLERIRRMMYVYSQKYSSSNGIEYIVMQACLWSVINQNEYGFDAKYTALKSSGLSQSVVYEQVKSWIKDTLINASSSEQIKQLIRDTYNSGTSSIFIDMASALTNYNYPYNVDATSAPLYFFLPENCAANQILVTFRLPGVANYGVTRIAFDKVDENGSPLTGAQFGVYDASGRELTTTHSKELGQDVSCAFTVTGNRHEVLLYGYIDEVFYIKEKVAPSGYPLPNTMYPVRIQYNATWDTNGDQCIQLAEYDAANPNGNTISGGQVVNGTTPTPGTGLNGAFMLTKRDAITGDWLNGAAVFKVYTDASCTTELTETINPDTNLPEPVTVSYQGSGVYASSTIYGPMGTTYYVREEQAPYGYTRDGNAYPFTLNGGISIISNEGSGTYFDNQPWKVRLRINKVDEETLRGIENSATFTTVTANGGKISVPITFTYNGSDTDGGYYESSWLYYNEQNQGVFVTYETLAPGNYYGDWAGGAGTAGSNSGKVQNTTTLTEANNGQTLIIGNDGTLYVNEEVKGEISIQKLDIEADTYINNGNNGDTTLVGSVYALYAAEDVLYPDGYRGVAFNAGDLVQVLAVDENGQGTFDNLYLGKYYVKEMYIVSPAGDSHLGFHLLNDDESIVTGTLMSYKWDNDQKALVFDEYNDVWKLFNDSGLFVTDNAGGFTANANATFTQMEYSGYLSDDVERPVSVLYDTESVPTIYDSTDTYEQVVKGKISWFKYESGEVSGGYASLQGAGFTIYRIDRLSKFDESWINPDGTFNLGLIRNAYLSPEAGAKYDADGNLVLVPVYDFSQETDAIATLYAYDSPNQSVTSKDDGSGSDLTSFYWNELQADIAAGKVTSLGNNLYRVNELFSDEYGMVTTPYLPFGQYLVVETTTPQDHEQAMPFVLELYKDGGKVLVSQGISEDIAFGSTLVGNRVEAGTVYETWYEYKEIILDKILNMRVYLYKYDSDTQQNILNPTAVYRLYQIEPLKINGVNVDSAEKWENYKALNTNIIFTTDENGVEVWNEINDYGYEETFELRVLNGVYYRCQRMMNEVDEEREDTFITKGIYVNGIMESCYLETQQLAIGTYLVEEEECPVGYWNNKDYYITFMVTSNREFWVEGTLTSQGGREYLFDEHYYDDETRGSLTIYKLGEVLVGTSETPITDEVVLDGLGVDSANSIDFVYEERYIGGARYAIIAKEDILTPDMQYVKDANGDYVRDDLGNLVRTTWFKEGDIVAVVDTALLGQNTECYVIYNSTTARAEVVYDETAGAYTAAYYGESSGTYNTYENGHPIVKVVCDTEGKVTVDLPLGEYTVKELSVPYGLSVTDDTYDVSFVWDNQWEQYVYNTSDVQVRNDVVYDVTRDGESGEYAEEGLVFTNERIKAMANISKWAKENAEGLQGVVFGLYTKDAVYDYRGNLLVDASSSYPVLLDAAVTDSVGAVQFKPDLPYGYYYESADGTYEVAVTIEEAIISSGYKVDILNGFETKTGYTQGQDTYMAVVYSDENGFVKEETQDEVIKALDEYVSGAGLVSGDYITIDAVTLYNILGETLPEADAVTGVITYADTFTYSDYMFVLVDELAGTYMLSERANAQNTGNYVVKEIATEYGVWLEDTDYGLSFHIYYNNDGTIKSAVIGTVEVEPKAGVNVGYGLITNYTSEVNVSKKDLANANELPGASLMLRDNTTGETVDAWTSTGTPREFRALRILDTLPTVKDADGTYMLREISAPSGYVVAMEDIYFCLVKKLDETGAVIPYENDVYVWETTYIEREVDIVVATGTYDDGKITWRLNENGVLEVMITDTSAIEYVFEPRTYTEVPVLNEDGTPKLDADGNAVMESVPTTKLPWEETLYQVDETGAYVLDGEGNKIPLNIEITSVVLDTRIAFAKLDELTLCTEQYFTCGFSGDPFQTTKVVKEVVDEGWYPAVFDKTVTVYNERTKGTTPYNPPGHGVVKISKQILTGENELEGALLTVYDAYGNVVDTWVSTAVPHYIYTMQPGCTYRLVEDMAPLGYAKQNEIVFTVTSDYTTHVTMTDDYSKVSFSKVDVTNGKELVGATLTVSEKETGEIIDTWISNGEPHVIVNVLEVGKEYVLTEVAAPDGYAIAESITFRVNDGIETTYIVMKDAPDVPTGDFTQTIPFVVIAFLGLIGLASAGYLWMLKRKKAK